MNVSVEEIYEMFYRKMMYAQRGVYPRKIVNWEKMRAKKDWTFFEHFTQLVNQNNGAINPSVYMDALIDHFTDDGKAEHFSPMLLPSLKGIKIYKLYVDEKFGNFTPDAIERNISTSIAFIVHFCVKNDINKVSEYLTRDLHYPVVLKHLKAGSVSPVLLSLLPAFKYMLSLSYPADVVQDICPNLQAELDGLKHKCIMVKSIAKIADDVPKLIEKLIKKKMEENKNKK